jgi:hypothetical protein
MDGIIKLLGSLIEGIAMLFNKKHSSKTYKARAKEKRK